MRRQPRATNAVVTAKGRDGDDSDYRQGDPDRRLADEGGRVVAKKAATQVALLRD